MASAEDLGDYYRLPPDLRDLNYGKFVEQGEIRITTAEDYHSHNAEQLDVEGMTKLLRKISFIQAISQGESAIPED
jgi:UDP-glucose 4-epimerase